MAKYYSGPSYTCRICGGPIVFRTTVICQEGTEEWMPLTAGVVESIARKQALIEPAPAPAADSSAAITGSDVANLLSVVFIIAGIIGVILSLFADFSTPGTSPPLINFAAMFTVLAWLLISLASILSGILILTRRK